MIDRCTRQATYIICRHKAAELETRLKDLEKGSQEAIILRAQLLENHEKVAEGEKVSITKFVRPTHGSSQKQKEILALVEEKKAEAQNMIEKAKREAKRLEGEAKERELEAEELKKVATRGIITTQYTNTWNRS